MAIVEKVRSMLGLWTTDPYQYECTVCDRSFETELETCPDCGGDVQRATGEFDSLGADPNP